jgi:cell division protein FtsI (penicillin-binding protein 3)
MRAKRAATKIRRNWVLALLAIATAGIVVRSVYLQLIQKDFLQDQGEERYLRVVEVPAHRGMIVDRNGEPLAVSSPVDSIWGNPVELLQNRDRLPELAYQLGVDAAELEDKLVGREQRQFVFLRRHLDPAIAQRVVGSKIPGVFSQREYRRYYPAGEVTSQLLGFTNIDDKGQEGLELTFNEWLQGIAGSKRVIKDRLGRIVEDIESISIPQPGKQLVLSIDRRIQYLAYRALKAAVIEHRANAACAVMLDVLTGEILAMVNQPAGNPNNRQEINSDLIRNRAVTDVYEPGSTLKPFTVAVALESGAYKPETPIDTSPGFMRVGGRLVRDVHNYGLIDVSRVIIKSSNVGVSKIALSMSPERLWRLYMRLGFNAQTGLNFPGEERGWLSHYSKWSAIAHANHAFGYGVSLSVLQLARAYAALASGGIHRPVTLLRREQPPPEEERILSAATTRKIITMLEGVVSEQGTGLSAAVPGYRVAGKTGTVHKIVQRRYSPDRYYSLFAGMAPASRPRLVMVVLVDDPKGGAYYGGQVAAPVFSKVMAGALRILNIPPDDLPLTHVAMVVKSPEER